MKYYSLINVRSTKGRNSKGSKITGIEVLNNDENKVFMIRSHITFWKLSNFIQI